MKNRLKFLVFLATATLTAPAVVAQAPQPPAPIVREAMAKLSWMAGEWRGDGWRMTPEGKAPFQVAEKAHFHLDGLVLVVDGRGWSVNEDGEEIEEHKAFGVLSYDAHARAYRFDAFVKEGYQSRSEPEVGDNEYRWSVPAGPGAEMKFHARLGDDGEWIETGERCTAAACVPALEMRLKKIAD